MGVNGICIYTNHTFDIGARKQCYLRNEFRWLTVVDL